MQNFKALGADSPDPQTQLRIANVWLRTRQLRAVDNYMRFCSFCFEQFFFDRSVANLMMLIIQ